MIKPCFKLFYIGNRKIKEECESYFYIHNKFEIRVTEMGADCPYCSLAMFPRRDRVRHFRIFVDMKGPWWAERDVMDWDVLLQGLTGL